MTNVSQSVHGAGCTVHGAGAGRKVLVLGAAIVLVLLASTTGLRAQAGDPVQLREQLRARYDIVALQGGVGLVPQRSGSDIRLIEVRDGAVSINGDPVTARDLRQRLGRDADLVLRVTYLDASAMQQLTLQPPAVLPTPPIPSESADRTDDRANRETARRHGMRRRGDTVRLGGSVTVDRGEYVEGNVVAIGGSAHVNGEVEDNLTVVGGSANLGPEALIHGNVAVVGGTLNRSPGARIEGKVDEVVVGEFGPFSVGPWGVRMAPWWGTFWRVGSLLGTLLRVTLLAMGVLLVTALGARYVESIGNSTAADPVRSGVTGLIAEVLFVPLLVVTVIVLAVSIIGIPLLFLMPFAIVLALVMMLVGFTGVSYHVGRLLSARFGIMRGLYGNVLLGLAAIVAVTVIAKLVGLLGGFVFGGFVGGTLSILGYLVEYLAWTVGIGAVVLTWLNTRRRSPGTTVTDIPPATT